MILTVINHAIMPRDIKLDCYYFSFKKQLVQEEYYFEDFFNSFNPENGTIELQQQFQHFYASFKNYFGAEFRINKNETKGITISSDDESKIVSRDNIVSGFFRGGDTGIGKTIQERNRANGGNPVDERKIHAIPHFFLLWMPLDTNFCIVIIQSYTGESLSGMFMQQIENYFKSHDIRTYDRRKFLPKDLVDDFRNNAKVKSVTLKSSKFSRPKRQGLNPILVEKENLNVEMTLKGFGQDTYWNDLRNWLTQPSSQLLGVDLSNLNLDDPIDTIVEYSYQGRTAKGKLTQEFQIIPSLIITEEIELNAKKHPVFESINTYSNVFLQELIQEIEYTNA